MGPWWRLPPMTPRLPNRALLPRPRRPSPAEAGAPPPPAVAGTRAGGCNDDASDRDGDGDGDGDHVQISAETGRLQRVMSGSHVTPVPAITVIEPGRVLYVSVEITDFAGLKTYVHSHRFMWNPTVPAVNKVAILNNVDDAAKDQVYIHETSALPVSFIGAFVEQNSQGIFNIEYTVATSDDYDLADVYKDPASTLDPDAPWTSIGASFDTWFVYGLDLSSSGGTQYSVCLRGWSDTVLAITACSNPVKVDSTRPEGFEVSVVTGIEQALLGDNLLVAWSQPPVDEESRVRVVYACISTTTVLEGYLESCAPMATQATIGMVELPVAYADATGMVMDVCVEATNFAGLSFKDCDSVLIDSTKPVLGLSLIHI